MKRVIFDTNIYGRIVENAELVFVANGIDNLLVNYGSIVVKQELKGYEGSRVLRYEGKVRKFRALLFEAYDLLVKKTYEIDERTSRLAKEYFMVYVKLGGNKPQNELLNDFLVVATASIHGLEIVYTEEKEDVKEGTARTMRSQEALKAYEIINELNKLNSPKFKSYKDLKATLKAKRWFA
ncbi:hypothetical protein HYU12_04545 [Candidatus Woesearchaeota archaeon]|nr:hypothetical protein [Candidatus Woesearchaeota archaeon]